jgi:phosphomannomutase/phosphoglucomutase
VSFNENILFGTNGIRGIVNQDMTPELVARIGVAIGTFFGGGDILIGYDGRTSNIFISTAIISGLVSTGCNVYDGGYAPTPALQYSVKHFSMNGAVIITASHNPPEYNGIKVVADDGVEISREEEIKIEDIFFQERFSRTGWNRLGRLTDCPNVIDVYKNAVKNYIDVESIKKERFKVVIDPVNSVGGLVTPSLLKELGCEVVTINAQIDGDFSRLPEPNSETLGDLSATVKALKADLGVAHDGDADRCVFVDEKGEVCWGDKTGALIVDYLLKRDGKGTVVTPISSSKLLEDIVFQNDSKLLWTRVGSTIVTKKMQEEEAEIGLEDNGGLFYASHQPVRDGPFAALIMLEILAKKRQTLSVLIDKLPLYFLIKERIICPNEKKSSVLAKILEETDGTNRLTIDGVKIFFDDGSVLMRPSGTEAVYRVYAEAKDENRAKEIAKWGVQLVKNAL